MTYITARAKTYGFNTTTTEDMKDMEDKLLSDVGNIVSKTLLIRTVVI